MFRTTTALVLAMSIGANLCAAQTPGAVQTLIPLTEGLVWEFQISDGAGPGQRAVLTNLPQRELVGRRVTPQELKVSQQSYLSFVVSDATGVYEYARQAPGTVGPEILVPPNFAIRYPLQVGAMWTGSSRTSVLRIPMAIATQTVIEGIDETVTVPAGTFRNCVKTETLGQTHNTGPTRTPTIVLEEHAWFCSGVGMVRSLRNETSSDAVIRARRTSIEMTAVPAGDRVAR